MEKCEKHPLTTRVCFRIFGSMIKPNYSYNALVVAKTYENAVELLKGYNKKGSYGAFVMPCLFLSKTPIQPNSVPSEILDDCKYVITPVRMDVHFKQALMNASSKHWLCWKIRCFEYIENNERFDVL